MSFLSNMLVNKNKNTAPETENDEIGKGTKVKVIAALLVVGFAVYVAWWVQEPGAVRADVLSEAEASQTESSSMVAEATTESAPAMVTQEVSIADFAFDPAELIVDKGTTVVWMNKDTVVHTITGDLFTSGTLDRGQSYSFTFDQDGVFEYYSSYYPEMKGTVVVGAGISDFLARESATEMASEESLTTDTLEPMLYDSAPVSDDSTLMTPAADMVGELGEAVSVTLTPEELMAQTAADMTDAETHAAAEESDKLASSGPEDFIYLGAFLAILFFNRRRLGVSL